MTVFSEAITRKALEALSADAMVRQNTRWGRLPLELSCDDGSALLLIFERNSVSEVERFTDADARRAVTVSGSQQQWHVILDGLHGGLHRAWRYRLLSFGGDPVQMMTFWKTLWRTGEALRAAQSGQDDGGSAQ